MPLQPGQDLLHYRLGDKLGEGGMGTVYRARDGKLGRDVALKFLPDGFAMDADRMARFTREAQVLASLNHPHIAGIYAVEDLPAEQAGDGARHRFLVMELVEGETLEERMARGPVPLEEALRITLQIATGLEEAHERGIIHRDLKPANVKLTPGKQVKILDFGLAKAFDSGTGSDPASSGGSGSRMSLSPTMTAGASQAGMLLGTAAYMSPEQARGEPADRRADIWALGVVLMEMLTGQRVHAGKTISDTLASVLARDPDWSRLPEDTPGAVRRLLERCLEKDSHQRLRDVGEVRIAIGHFLEHPEEEPGRAGAAVPAAAPLWRRALPWVLAAGLAATTLAATMGWLSMEPRRPEILRAQLALPDGEKLFTGYGTGALLSPDGRSIATVLGPGNATQLRVRALDQVDGILLAQGDGNNRPYQPFFSPDGQWIGFVTPAQMRKVPRSGGTPIKICDLSRARGATWGPDGTIVYAPDPSSGLMQIPDSGGEPRPLTTLDTESGERTHRWPQWLPDGRALIFTSHSQLTDFSAATIEILVPETGERRTLYEGGTYPRYVEARDGSSFIVYASNGSLFAIPFDLTSLETHGPATPVVQGVTMALSEGSAQYSVSGDGTAIYASGASALTGHTIVKMSRGGEPETLWEESQFYRNPALSPDGSRLAVDIWSEGQSDIWILDLQRDVPTRITFSSANDTRALWSPDGSSVTYLSEGDEGSVIYRTPSDGSGEPEKVFATSAEIDLGGLTADGRLLSFSQRIEGQNWDVGILPVDREAEPRMLVSTPFLETSSSLSPDGRWLAYASNESGEFEVYVRSVEGQGKWQISSGGGFWPLWSADGKELLYLLGPSIYGAPVKPAGATLGPGRARPLLDDVVLDVGFAYPYASTPDGSGFVLFRMGAGSSEDSHEDLQMVLNWDTELIRTFGK